VMKKTASLSSSSSSSSSLEMKNPLKVKIRNHLK